MSVSQTYEKGVNFELRALSTMIGTGEQKNPKFQRTGYNFREWYRYDELGNIHTYTDKYPSANFTTDETWLSAAWNAIAYNITYSNVNPGENPSTNPTTYTIESEDITFYPAIRNGYGCTWNPKTIATGSYGNKETVAQWELCTYTITYLGLQEGDVNPDTNPKTYTIETTGKNYDTATRTGYTCTWNPAGFSTGSTGNLSTTASWTINKHTVSYTQPAVEGQINVYNADGSEYYPTGSRVEFNTTLSVQITENEGYALSALKVNGIDITESRTFTMPDAPVVINAIWNDIQGIVYFDPGY